MTAATKTQQTTLEASTSHTSPLDTSKVTTTQAQLQITTWQENSTHNIMERSQQELSTIPPRRHRTATLRYSSSNTTAKEQEDGGHYHTLHHVLQLQVIPPPADRLRSIYTCLPEGLHARPTATTLWRISSTILHGYQQEDSCLRHQVCYPQCIKTT